MVRVAVKPERGASSWYYIISLILSGVKLFCAACSAHLTIKPRGSESRCRPFMAFTDQRGHFVLKVLSFSIIHAAARAYCCRKAGRSQSETNWRETSPSSNSSTDRLLSAIKDQVGAHHRYGSPVLRFVRQSSQ